MNPSFGEAGTALFNALIGGKPAKAQRILEHVYTRFVSLMRAGPAATPHALVLGMLRAAAGRGRSVTGPEAGKGCGDGSWSIVLADEEIGKGRRARTQTGGVQASGRRSTRRRSTDARPLSKSFRRCSASPSSILFSEENCRVFLR